MNTRSIDSPVALLQAVEELGFLPFFRNEIPGFSVEEHTPPQRWFADYEGDPVENGGPWEWKGPVAVSGRCVYGKFFRSRAGFISLEHFPDFANYRRDGYDFDARYDDGLASYRDKAVYDVLAEHGSLLSRELKRLSGYGPGGEKGFDGVITRLQRQTYVIISNFEYAMDRYGREYGWGIARYSTPEARFGEELLEAAYRREPAESRARVYAHLRALTGAEDAQLRRLLGD